MLTIDQLADITGLSKMQIRGLKKDGKISFTPIGPYSYRFTDETVTEINNMDIERQGLKL